MFISSLVGVAAGLATFGIGCTGFYPIIAFFLIFFWLVASFAVFLLGKKRRLLSIFIAGISMWIALSVTVPIPQPRMPAFEIPTFVIFDGIITMLAFIPAFFIALILKFKAKKTLQAHTGKVSD